MPDLTFLFTDIEGSSRLWNDHPHDMARAVARHDMLLRHAIVSYGGRVFGTAGDSFAAAFEEPAAALSSAVAAQQQLDGEDWPAATPIRVRMGLHRGPSFDRDGNHYGPTLNTLGRLHSVAHGRQTIASDAVALGAGVEAAPVHLHSLGLHRLKDVPDPLHVYQVCGPGPVERFPPLRTLAPALGAPDLPSPVLGRDDDRRSLERAASAVRLCSVTGPPGVGKTTLVAFWADERRTSASGPPLWVGFDHRTVDGPVQHLANVLAPLAGARDPLDTLVQRLDGVESLVLDGVDGAEEGLRILLPELLERCPSLRIVTTARRPLGLHPEHVVPVRGLDHPAADELFWTRVEEAGGRRRVDPASAAAVTAACRGLDGSPLGIELLAARHVHRPEELGEVHKAAGPVTELRDLVAAALDDLDPVVSAALERVAVCDRWFDSAEASDERGSSGLRVLEDCGIVVSERRTTGVRHRLVEPFRVQVVERLGPERRRSHERSLLDHLDRRMARLGAAFEGPGDIEAMIELDERLEDLRAAHRTALTEGRVDQAMRLLGALVLPMNAGARYWLGALGEEVLALPGADEEPSHDRVAAIVGWSARSAGRLDDAAAVVARNGRAPGHSSLRLVRGWIAHAQGRASAADEAFREAVALARHEGATWYANALAQTALSGTYRGGDFATIGRAAAEVATEGGSNYVRAFSSFARAEAVWREAPDEAADAFATAIDVANRGGFLHTRAIATAGGAALAARRGDIRSAAAGLLDGLRFARAAGARTVELPVLENAAALLARAGRDRDAVVTWYALLGEPGVGATDDQMELLAAAERRLPATLDAAGQGSLLGLRGAAALVERALDELAR